MATITKVKTKSGTRWKALVRAGGRSKSKTFRLKSNAKLWAEELERDRELAVALASPGASIRFAELGKEYIYQYQGRDKSREQRVRFWIERIGTVRLVDIKPHMVKAHLNAYAGSEGLTYAGKGQGRKTKSRPSGKRRTPATVNRMKAALAAVLRYAREQEYITGRPATADVPTLPENNKRTRFLDADERKRLLKACRDSDYDRLYLLVILALTTGCRLSEMLTLRWKDVNLEEKSIWLPRTKNEDPRMVPLAKPAIEELKRFRGIGNALLFPGKRRTNRPFSGFRQHWNKAKEVAHVKDFRMHDCRHDVGSSLAMAGYSLLEIGEILGHRSAQTTKRYAHVSTDHKRKIIEDVFNEMEGNGNDK